LLQKSRQEIKLFLLDQRRVAGLGNIYVCECLFRARIHPARRCHTLHREETRRLARAIRSVLRLAIRNRGTSFSDFVDPGGRAGENQKHLKVFKREGKKCFRCKAPIQRVRQGNRSTFYCAYCQK
jgi:formamidopyrimidine-DNA glycosylase